MEGQKQVKKARAFELDFLRGFALFMMIFMHLSYDIRYILRIDAFGFHEKDWFWVFIEPFFLCVFVGISGICCSFSKNNFLRGLKLLGVALFITFATYIATYKMGIECFIIFNVLHMLAVSILVYSLIALIEEKTKASPRLMNVLIALLGLYATQVGTQIDRFEGVETNLLIPFGITGPNTPFMGDYMPLFPWIGVFLLGAVVGRTCYSSKETLFKNAPAIVHKISKPFEFMGRHSLIIYLVHQPLVLGLCYAIEFLVKKI